MEEERKKKIFLVKIGVISVMAVILVLWTLNLGNFFAPEPGSRNRDEDREWAQIKDEFHGLSDNFAQQLEKRQNKTENATSSAFINDLVEATNKLAASSSTNAMTTSSPLIATSSTSTDFLKNNCPAYINCMPTIGESKPCQIPVGCEGITQIAY